MGELGELSEAECRALLSGSQVARIAVVAPDGPHIIPVNYALVDEHLIFRTHPSTVLGMYADGAVIAFELDATDERKQEGWSVVARGRASVLGDSPELAHIRRVWDPNPWADGERNLYFRLKYSKLTGRRVMGR